MSTWYTAKKSHCLDDIQADILIYFTIQDGFFELSGLEGGFQGLGLFLLCLHARLFIDACWSPAGKGLTSWLTFVMSNC